MTRLADALERANARAGGPAPTRQGGPPVHAPSAPSSAPALALVNTPADIDPRLTEGASLLALPRRPNGPAGWRTDPELIGKLVGTDDFSSGAREQYRKLAALLHHGQVERGLKVVMTSSALPGEGKSLTAVNLALTLSESYQRKVLLIDADLRRPTIQRIFGIPPVAGLNEILKSNEDTQMTVTQITERLFVLPAGRPDSDPISGLTSQRMQRVLAHAGGALRLGAGGYAATRAAARRGAAHELRRRRAARRPRGQGAVLAGPPHRRRGHPRADPRRDHERRRLAHDRNAGGYYEYYGYGYGGTPDKK